MELNAFQLRVLKILVEMGLKGRAHAYRVDRWDKKVTSTVEADEVRLTEEDGMALVNLGLLEKQESGTVGWTLTPEGIVVGLSQIPDYKPMDVEAMLRWVLGLDYFHPSDLIDGEIAIPAIYVPGKSKLVLVLGENAGGKSFFRRLVHLACHPGRNDGYDKIKNGPFSVQEVIHISMQGRTSGGVTGSFIYGTEQWQSTGENSTNTVRMGIKTARERSHTTVLYWDEPDIGMSAGSAAGAGVSIREFIQAQSPLVQAVFVTSHSPALIQQFRDLDPHYLYLGNAEGPATLDEWFVSQMNPIPVQPEELMAASNRRFQQIQAILDNKKRSKK